MRTYIITNYIVGREHSRLHEWGRGIFSSEWVCLIDKTEWPVSVRFRAQTLSRSKRPSDRATLISSKIPNMQDFSTQFNFQILIKPKLCIARIICCLHWTCVVTEVKKKHNLRFFEVLIFENPKCRMSAEFHLVPGPGAGSDRDPFFFWWR